ncbi:MAG TPA: LptA/OstA family protein [Defluviitoga sp.]|nr:LptA/OstA family protein [Defluviitoga sp.]HOP24200.1 LptA/OstA family protein [Defluviitoga sp.]HPZ28208.1 LptA/OstA family protein [Defluviitoga sp.]HQD62098.1 LptA/OstA family protein [Defluviitoga sp.]
MKKTLDYVLVFLFVFVTTFSFSATINVKADNVKGEEKQYILTGNVLIQKEDLIITTDYATITLVNDEWREVKTNKVHIKSKTFEANSNHLDFDLQTEKGTLSGNVESNIFLEESLIKIICEELSIDNSKKLYEGSSPDNVLITKDDYLIKSKNFKYDESAYLLSLFENVKIVNEKKKIDMDSQAAFFNTKTNEIEARSVNLILQVED